MHSISQELDQLLNGLDPQSAAMLECAVRDALKKARGKSVESTSKDAFGYPIDYFETTAGSFENEPLEAPADLPYEQREAW